MRNIVRAGLWILATCLCLPVFAATPASGTISPATPETSFESGPFLTSTGVFCIATMNCESYELIAELPADYAVTNPGAFIRIGLAWNFKLDIFTFNLFDEQGNDITAESTSITDLGAQIFYLPAGAGTRKLRLQITPTTPNNSVIHGLVSLLSAEGEGLRPNPVGPGVPRYQVYAPPAGLSGNTGEPSMGYNPFTGNAFILSGLNTLWGVFPQNQMPQQPLACEAEWENRSSPITSVTSLDPIGITDSLVRGHETGRTIIGQLIGVNSASAYTDNDGGSYLPMQGGPPASSTDHQTFAAGPYPANHPFGIVPNPIYPNAIYYCGQDIAFASCARSDTGGLTFGPPTIIFTVIDCVGLHGHARVGPDGAVYVPSKACGTNVAVIVSEDAGLTWDVRPVPNTVPAVRDPQIALATDGTGYMCFVDGDKNAKVAVTKDRGLTWTEPVAVGLEMGIKHAMFTQAIAGDPDRATCAYLGTTTEGNPVAADFPGTWHLYFSTTYDGGGTWTTVNATPSDPVQGAGGIWNVGGGPPNRNLLDFNEMSIDERGYPMYGYADGCIGECDADPMQNTFAALPKIARQIAGRSLYAEFDQPEPRPPAAACLAGTRTPERTQLTWRQPENGGAAISQYRIFRGTAPGAETFIGTTGGTPGYIDLSADPAVEKYFYKVTALNASGEGLGSNEIELPVTIPESESACGVPGLRLITDGTGDGAVPLPAADLVSLHVSEPLDVEGKLIFQLKVSALSAIPPGTMYAVRFHAPDQPLTSPNDSFVGMVMGAQPSFVYGHRDEVVVAVASVQTYVIDGALDPASNYSPDGTITLVLPRETFALENGQQLRAFSINAHTGALPSGEHVVRSNTILDSAVGASPYTLRNDKTCALNTSPVALLKVTPEKGVAPLEAVLDASASSDGEDEIIEYVFDPGDGTPQTTQSSPVLTHRYAQPGFYRATLQVMDARGVLSTNVAQAIVDTTGTAAATAAAPVRSRFGGAWGGGALLLLMLGAALRLRGMSGN